MGTSRDNIQPRGTAACCRTQVLHSAGTSHTGSILTVAQTVKGGGGGGDGDGGESDRERAACLGTLK